MRKFDKADNRDYRVTLECGCTIRTRNAAMYAGQTFVCPGGLGHGYRLRWRSCVGPNGYPTVNPGVE